MVPMKVLCQGVQKLVKGRGERVGGDTWGNPPVPAGK